MRGQTTPDSAGRYTPTAAAFLIGVNGRTITNWCKRGRLSGAVQLPSGTWRIPHDAIAHLIPASRTAA